MKRSYALMLLVLSLAVITITSSCGGGGGDGGAGAQPTATHLYYFNKTTNGLFFYDPATKASTTVESGGMVGADAEVLGGTYHASTKEITDVHLRTMVYAKTDGRLYKLSLLSSGTHTPVQLSNETAADTICNCDVIPDFADHDNSIYAYELAGTDGLCYPPNDADNVWKAVRLSTGPSVTPMEITTLNKEPFSEIRDWSTAAIVGELAVNHTTDTLEKCTIDFQDANCTTLLLSGPTYTVKESGFLAIDVNGKKTYLWVFDGSEYQVRTYDPVSNAVSAPVYTTMNAIAPGLQDLGAEYFGEVHTLKKMTFGTIPAVVSLFTETKVREAMLTDNRIMYVSQDDLSTGASTTTYTLKSALKSNGTSTSLVIATYPATVELAIVTGSGVFYNLTSGSTHTAGFIRDNGTGRHEVGDARWTAASYSNRLLAPVGTSVLNVMRSDESTGNIRSFDASTYSSASTGILLGTMPIGAPDYMDAFYGGGVGSTILGIGYNASGGDVFSVNVNNAGSLYRVTNTTDDEALSR